MKIKRILAGFTNCYLIYDKDGIGILIDPGGNAKRILRELERCKVKLEKIVITHGHFDHIESLDYLRSKTGVPVFIHRQDGQCLTDPVKNLSHYFESEIATSPAEKLLQGGEELTINGRPVLKVIHTPGHSPGGICLYSEEEGFLISGDTVFEKGIGRTDFPGCNYNLLLDAIKNKIFPLPEETVVYPGHGNKTDIAGIKSFIDELFCQN